MKNSGYKYVSYATSIFVLTIVTGIFVLLFTTVQNINKSQNINPDQTQADTKFIKLSNSPLILNQGSNLLEIQIEQKGFDNYTEIKIDLGCGENNYITGKIIDSKFIAEQDQAKAISFCNIKGKGNFIVDNYKFEFEYLPVYSQTQNKCALIDKGNSNKSTYTIEAIIADEIEQPIRRTNEVNINYKFDSSCFDYKNQNPDNSIITFKIPQDKKNCVLQAEIIKTFTGMNQSNQEKYLCSAVYINKDYKTPSISPSVDPTRTLPIETPSSTTTQTITVTSIQSTPPTNKPTSTKQPIITKTPVPTISKTPSPTLTITSSTSPT